MAFDAEIQLLLLTILSIDFEQMTIADRRPFWVILGTQTPYFTLRINTQVASSRKIRRVSY